MIHTQQNYIAAYVKVVLYTYTANFFSKCFNSKSFSFFYKMFFIYLLLTKFAKLCIISVRSQSCTYLLADTEKKKKVLRSKYEDI